MRSIWLVLLVGVVLLAGCGAAENAAAPPLPPTATVGAVTEPTQGATPIAAATAESEAITTPAATPVAAATATVDDVTDPTQGATPNASGAGNAPLLISMHKTGGIAGVDEYVAVYAGGRLELRGKNGAVTRSQVAAADLQAMEQLLASPEVASLAGRYQSNAADAFIYELALGKADGTSKTVVFTDAAAHPPVLDQLLAELQRLRATAQ